MRKLLPAILFVSLATSSSGEIVYDWSFFDKTQQEVMLGILKHTQKVQSALQKMTKCEIQELVSDAALHYTTNDYADLDPYDFLAEKRKIVIKFHDGKSGYFARKYAQPTILFSLDLLAEENAFSLIAVHEFSHAYDDVIDYHLERRFRETQDHEEEFLLRKKLEARAMKKEEKYMLQNHDGVPPEIYQRLLDCYARETCGPHIMSEERFFVTGSRDRAKMK